MNGSSTIFAPFSASNASNQDSKYDHLLIELETSDTSTVALAIRAIYDGDEHDRFMEKLDSRIKNHDKDIERMCNCHYQGFVDCIHELLKVRPQATSLKNEIIQINHELQRSSENIQRKADELIKYRRVVCNTKTAIEHLQECLPVLETFSKLTQQMAEKKYYPALKTLEQFETLYMPKVRAYRFAQSMCQRVPRIRETIKRESMKDLKDFLENIRQLTAKIGEIAMKNVASQHRAKEFASAILSTAKSGGNNSTKTNNNNNNSNNNTNHNNDNNNWRNQDGDSNSNQNPVTTTADNLDGDEEEEEEDYLFANEELSATDIVDFSPVYRCLHIFGCLGAREQFENYYRQQRRQQARLILQSISTGAGAGGAAQNNPITSTSGNNSTTLNATNFSAASSSPSSDDTFRNYLFGVVGFFVIEDHLLNTSSGLVTRQYLADNWQDASRSVIENAHSYAIACRDSAAMLRIKSLLMLFCCTAQSYGYSVEPLLKLLVELRQLYTDILLTQWSTVFARIFDSDNYHPLQINCRAEFDEHFADFPFAEIEMFKRDLEAAENGANSSDDNQQPEQQQQQQDGIISQYPKRFAFSSFVPKVYKAVREFIATSLEFTRDLNLSDGDIEDTVRKSTNQLLMRTLSGSLSRLIKKPNLGLLQLIQISINTNYLEEASTYLEMYITELIHHNHRHSQQQQQQQQNQTSDDHSKNNPNNNPNNPNNSENDDERYQRYMSSLQYSPSIITGSGGEPLAFASQSHLARLQGRSMFKDARSEAEAQIYIQLNNKIDEFFELATYDYMLADSPGKASSYILDLMAFLKSTFEAFTNLPIKVAQTGCLSSCKYISGRLLAMLIEEDVKAISHGFLQQFNLDLMQCEMFAGSEPVREFEDGALQSCFAELRQIMDLFIEFDAWTTYFAEFGRNDSRYLRVNPQTALTLLEKLVRGDHKRNIFSNILSKNEREKKQRIETIQKKLKALIASNANN